MPSRIAGFAKGFLSLMDAQNFGNAPHELGELINPTVEMGDLFLLSKQVGFFGSNNAPANGFNLLTAPAGIDSKVPAGEVWRVHAASIIVACGAGAAINATPAVRVDGNAIPLGDLVVVAATQTLTRAIQSAPFWLNAGSELGFYAQGTTLAPVVAFQALVSRLKA